MRKLASGAASVLIALFPIIAVVCARFTDPAVLIAGLGAILLFHAVCSRSNPRRGLMPAVTLAVVSLLLGMAAIDSEMAVLLYPVFVSAAMAIAFGATLISPPAMIERFARLQHPDFPDCAIRYTRNVTIVWVVFFIINGWIAAWTALAGSWSDWALYNGLISYLLIGVLIVGEVCVRARLRPREGGI